MVHHLANDSLRLQTDHKKANGYRPPHNLLSGTEVCTRIVMCVWAVELRH